MRELTEQQVEQALREAQAFFKEQAGDDEATLLDTLVGADEYRRLLACPQERLAPFIDGRVPGEERRQIEAHLKVCPFCREEVAETRALVRAWQWQAVLGEVWSEIREALRSGSPGAKGKWEEIGRALRQAAPRWGRLQPKGVPVRERVTTKAFLGTVLGETLQPTDERVALIPVQPPTFTAEGVFSGTLTLPELRFESHTVALTVCSEGQPIVTFTAELRRTEERTLTAAFEESGLEGLPEGVVPGQDLEARILPPAG